MGHLKEKLDNEHCQKLYRLKHYQGEVVMRTTHLTTNILKQFSKGY